MRRLPNSKQNAYRMKQRYILLRGVFCFAVAQGSVTLFLGGHWLGSGKTMGVLARRKACAFIHLSEMEGFVASHLARARQPLQQCQFHSLSAVSVQGWDIVVLPHVARNATGLEQAAGWAESSHLPLSLQRDLCREIWGAAMCQTGNKNTAYI